MSTSSEFEAEVFLRNENLLLEDLVSLQKAQLRAVAQSLQIKMPPAARKDVLVQAISTHLGLELDEEEGSVESSVELEKYKLDLEFKKEQLRLERELKMKELEREREREKEEREFRLRERELEIQREIKLAEAQGQPRLHGRESETEVIRNIKLVPKFNEKDAEKFFLHFEKVAESMRWSKEIWPMLLQSVLTGKAQEVYSALSIEQSSSYDVVKSTILQAYELVPEAYRQKFRDTKKQADQTHVEFARDKETLFDRWCSSMKVGSDYEKLRELMLLEEFKCSVSKDIKIHLEETKVASLKQAAVMADDYELTHKHSFVRNTGYPSHKGYQERRGYYPKTGGSPKKASMNQKGSDAASKPDGEAGQKEKRERKFFPGPKCFHCKKMGHVMSDCWFLKNRREEKKSTVSLVSTKRQVEKSDLLEKSEVAQEKREGNECFQSFISQGSVSETEKGQQTPIAILRDTGASQTLLSSDVLTLGVESSEQASVLVQGIEGQYRPVPLRQVYLQSELIKGPVSVAVVKQIPVEGVQMLLGNDLAGDKVKANPRVIAEPEIEAVNDTELKSEKNPEIYNACVVTRSMTLKEREEQKKEADEIVLAETFLKEMETCSEDEKSCGSERSKEMKGSEKSDKELGGKEYLPCSRETLVKDQENDPEIRQLCEKALTVAEAGQEPVCYYRQAGVLMRKWRPPEVSAEDEWKVVYQIVLPSSYRKEVLQVAHETPTAGHLGVNKTESRILQHFYWPGIRRDVAEFCKTCHTCQVVGKPNQKVKPVPLRPISVIGEPFSKVIVDCVGPLPRTKAGNKYLLTIMCAATRFPEAVPLREISAPTVVRALTKFFTVFGLPKQVQTDLGSNFMSGIFQQAIYQLEIKHNTSTAYHPQSQGALERYHQTLKTMIRAYCVDNEKEWDEGIHLLLFATREVVQQSLGFSPFELVFGHTVRGPLKALKEKWLDEGQEAQGDLLDYVYTFKTRLHKACKVAHDNLEKSQEKMKEWYDKRAAARHFSPGDKVLVLLPIAGEPLRAKFCGPYTVERKVNDLNYVIATPDRRKAKRLCHVNMLKQYFERREKVQVALVKRSETKVENGEDDIDANCVLSEKETWKETKGECKLKLENSDALKSLHTKLSHLNERQSEEMVALVHEYKELFSDSPGLTQMRCHDVDVGESRPVKQHPYRVNPRKKEIIDKEIAYMLEKKIIEPSQSEWSSPILLVPKPDGSSRLVVDYRKLNSVTRDDSYPISRIDDCIDRVGKAKYVSKFDLLKGYWQIPLTERAKEMSALVVHSGVYVFRVLPYGMKNSAATFQRVMNEVIAGLKGCEMYIDDAVVYSDTWEEHVERIRAFFERLKRANLVINLVKSELAQAHVTYLGHEVGQGCVKPREAKVQAILEYPVPNDKKQLMRFLGMIGYYRKFCRNFSDVVCPLTRLLKKNVKFLWNDTCQSAFEKAKAILMNSPVLSAPDFDKPFKLMIDASDVGVGAVLMQENEKGIEHPVCYFSRKLNKHQQKYATIEKEGLALVLALQHFEVYVNSGLHPIVVYTDHNPLTFLGRMKANNQRILRWSLLLQEYNLVIRHVPGKENVVADALSRV